MADLLRSSASEKPSQCDQAHSAMVAAARSTGQREKMAGPRRPTPVQRRPCARPGGGEYAAAPVRSSDHTGAATEPNVQERLSRRTRLRTLPEGVRGNVVKYSISAGTLYLASRVRQNSLSASSSRPL